MIINIKNESKNGVVKVTKEFISGTGKQRTNVFLLFEKREMNTSVNEFTTKVTIEKYERGSNIKNWP